MSVLSNLIVIEVYVILYRDPLMPEIDLLLF